jgi:hypothetical protein
VTVPAVPAVPAASVRSLAGKAHRTLEPVHAFIYFDPGAAARYTALGLTHARTQYFASRAAAFGPCGPELVIATFYNFAPHQVRRALPAAWSVASPEAVLDARFAAAEDTLAPAAAELLPGTDLDEAVALARAACEALSSPGRPLYAAYAELAWPTPPALALFHAVTLLREWRGDAHIALLVAAGIGPVEALLLHAACGGPAEPVLQASRGWNEPEWEAGRSSLVARGLLDETGRAPTAAGAALRQQLEDGTDAIDLAVWSSLGVDQVERLRTLVRPLSARLAPMMAMMLPRQDPAGG